MGKYRLCTIDEPYLFWCLIDELGDDNSHCNREALLQAYSAGILYGLELVESKYQQEREAGPNTRSSLFCAGAYPLYLLPCLCVKQHDSAIIIWTHVRARNRGFAKKMVEQLNVKTAFQPLTTSIGFWEKCNIPEKI